MKAVVAEIALEGRCWTSMACGTGKTIVGAEVSRQVAEHGRVLVIVPTLELLAQTARSYAAHLGMQAGRVRAVCSDFGAPTIDAGALHAVLDELHVDISTNPRNVAEWARTPGRLTVLSTYASLPVIAAACGQGASWDLVVVDEAHRSAGRVDRAWHIIHQDEAIPARRRLYMTATPRIIGTDQVEATSMDDPAVFGPEVYQMPFARAIEEGLLADYKVIVTTMTPAELAKLDTGPDTVLNAGGPALPAQMLVAQLALLKASAEYGIRRAITFHRRVASAKQYARTLPNAADLLPASQRPSRMYAAAVDGSMSLADRREVLRHLDRPAGRLVVVSNARVLGEGVDVPELDGVVFADPRDSATDVVQAAGRALRRGRSADKTAYIIVPVLVQDAESLEAALDSSAWDVLYRVLRALRAHDERLADWLDAHRAAMTTGADFRGREPGEGNSLPPWLQLTGTAVDPAFAEALRLRVLEHTTSVWLEGLGAARAYRAEHGHLRVPVDHVTDDGVALGKWILRQRTAKRKQVLASERVQALDELDIVWDVKEAEWQDWLAVARAWHAEHGHLRPTVRDLQDGRRIGDWVCRQRIFKRRGELSQERIADLDELGMVWDDDEANWEEWLAVARAWHAEHGHLRIPTEAVTADRLKLGLWVMRQRSRKHARTAEEIAELDALGMDWDPRETDWQTNLAAARAWHAEHGHLRVPHKYVTPEGIRLGQWIRTIRRSRKHNLSADKLAELEKLGMVWDSWKPTWEASIAAARAYHTEHGHLNVPVSYVTDDGIRLGTWIANQRSRRAHGQLAIERVAELDALEMEWDPYETGWRQRYAALVAFFAEHGHADVPDGYVTPDGIRLDGWIRAQRSRRRRGVLRNDRFQALDALGVDWNPPKGPRSRPTLVKGTRR